MKVKISLALTVLLSCVLATYLYLPKSVENSTEVTKVGDKLPTKMPQIPLPSFSISISGNLTSNTLGALADATVCFVELSAPYAPKRECVQTNEQGNYVSELASGKFRITAAANNHNSDSKIIEVSADSAPITIDFSLDSSPSSISGHVSSADGKNVSQASISAFQNNILISTVFSDDDGNFSMWVPSGPTKIEVVASGYSASTMLANVPVSQLHVKLFPGYSLTGVVLDKSTDNPVSSVTIAASKELIDRHTTNKTGVTDENGRFIINGLDPGSMFLSVLDHQWAQVDTTVVVIDSKKINQQQVIYVDEGATVSGLLSTSNGGCNQGGVALLDPQMPDNPPISMRTQNGGLVQFEALPKRLYVAVAECREKTLAEGPKTIDLTDKTAFQAEWRFSGGNVLDVYVKDSKNRPVMEANLYLQKSGANENESDNNFIRDTVAGADGHYQFGGLEPGDYELIATPAGLNPLPPTIIPVSISGGQTPQELQITLAAGAEIIIQSKNTDESPHTSLFYYALNENSERIEAYHTGAGVYKIAPITEGVYRVFAYDNKNPEAPILGSPEQSIFVENNNSVELTWTAQNFSGSISGQVIDAIGNPVQHAAVEISSSEILDSAKPFAFIQEITRGKQAVLSNEEGIFTAHGLDPNSTFDILASGPDGLSATQSNLTTDSFITVQLKPTTNQ